ncbi:uncharacterized protein BX663DRAFT_550176 [Cokeromyces recurvatus]|uniref:uncharacterized protein n=1 Tax=Cokeromyces recurvatus TaxID=90255 RepID=UPI0022208414|nr:uncharacterized protein BX663DRAFT_550176 [Cokeromyces recurvatus]KAI7904497.1 hypothetical protein BX663DRAFT_550176 [Cokeromyces recurvatus]
MVKDNPQTTVNDVLESLTERFDNLKISKTQLHHHMKTTLNLTVKYATFEPKAGDNADNLDTRYHWVRKRGGRAIVKTPETHSVSHAIVGATSASTVLHVVIKRPPTKADKTKEKTSKTQKSIKEKKKTNR